MVVFMFVGDINRDELLDDSDEEDEEGNDKDKEESARIKER